MEDIDLPEASQDFRPKEAHTAYYCIILVLAKSPSRTNNFDTPLAPSCGVSFDDVSSCT